MLAAANPKSRFLWAVASLAALLLAAYGAWHFGFKHDSKSGEREALQRSSQAKAARENLLRRDVGRGQGFGEKLDALEGQWAKAEEAMKLRSWGTALAGYAEVLKRVKEVESLEGERKAALTSQAQAMEARRAGEEAQAAENADVLWAQAEAKRQSGESLLAEGKLAESRTRFEEAQQLHAQAREQAPAVKEFRRAKGEYEQLVRETGAAELVRRYGGEEGERVRQLVKEAASLGETRAQEGAAQYTAAARAWPGVVEAAQRREKAAKEAADALAAAKRAETAQDWDEMGKQAQAVLGLDSRNGEAQQLRNRASAGKFKAQVAEAMGAARKLEGEKKWAEAQTAANQVLLMDAGNAEAMALLERVKQSLDPQYASKEAPWTNSLGMPFVPVPGTKALFCIWDVRVQDFEAFMNATDHVAASKMPPSRGTGGRGARSRQKARVAALGMFSLRRDGWKQRGDTWKSAGFSQGPTHPVVGVTWEDAKAFCRWLTEKERKEGLMSPAQSYRLPTDAEWSVAVGLNEPSPGMPNEKDGKIKDQFPWGTQWPPPEGAGNYAGNEAKDGNWPPKLKTIQGYHDNYARTSPVGSFNANRLGLYDMGGNVWQWCEDWYDSEQKYRVLRGASWCPGDRACLFSSYRNNLDPAESCDTHGFRCALAPAASSP